MILAIIQARMDSTRLPGKVMEELEGTPLLWHVVDRLKHSKNIDRIVIATSDSPKDKKITQLAKKYGIDYYTGSENDVLDRFYRTSLKYRPDIIARITADCPLIDPSIVDKVIEKFTKSKCDYLSNTLKPTFPDGLDVEVFSFKALEKSWKMATLPSEREHVTSFIVKNPQLFKLKNFENDIDLSMFRWTVDEKCDREFIRGVYKRLYEKGRIFYMRDVLNLLHDNPWMKEINAGIARNDGYTKSLKENGKVK